MGQSANEVVIGEDVLATSVESRGLSVKAETEAGSWGVRAGSESRTSLSETATDSEWVTKQPERRCACRRNLADSRRRSSAAVRELIVGWGEGEGEGGGGWDGVASVCNTAAVLATTRRAGLTWSRAGTSVQSVSGRKSAATGLRRRAAAVELARRRRCSGLEWAWEI